MSSVVISGDTSGSITLAAPAVAGTNTLTLPANTGTVITTASSGQVIPKAALPTGSVLQVVNATSATEASNNTSTYADTGLSATITPTSSTSKILVLVSQSGVGKSNDNTANGVNLNLIRGSTQIIEFTYRLAATGSATFNLGFSASTCYLDSPATTSATTYKTQFKNFNNSNAVYAQMNNATSTITLLEIAA